MNILKKISSFFKAEEKITLSDFFSEVKTLTDKIEPLNAEQALQKRDLLKSIERMKFYEIAQDEYGFPLKVTKE